MRGTPVLGHGRKVLALIAGKTSATIRLHSNGPTRPLRWSLPASTAMMPAMSFTAVWPISDDNDTDAADELTVVEPDDVDTLLTRLSAPGAGPAVIEHQDREPITDTEGLLGSPGSTKIPDHDVAAAVHGGFGYLTHADPDHDYSTLVGDPASPEYRSEYVDYPAGAGVPLDRLADALKDFLATAKRPTTVEWQSA